MPEYFEQDSEPGFRQRYLGGWRVVASAWAVAIMIVLALGGVQAVASHKTLVQQPALIGAVIPRHDPSCGGPGDVTPGAPASCHITGDVLERAEADAEAGGAYGY